MKNKLWKQWMLSGVLVSAMVVSCGVSVSVQAEETTETEEAAETDSSAESEDDLRILFDQAVEDAMIAEDGEILPVVSLDEGEPYAVYNEEALNFENNFVIIAINITRIRINKIEK